MGDTSEATTPRSEALEELRARIDRIDDGLLVLLRDRLDACKRIAVHKREQAIPMMQPHRLAAVRAKAENFAEQYGIEPTFLTGLFDLITAETCRLEDEIIGVSEDASPRR